MLQLLTLFAFIFHANMSRGVERQYCKTFK